MNRRHLFVTPWFGRILSLERRRMKTTRRKKMPRKTERRTTRRMTRRMTRRTTRKVAIA
jgi:hypothetical protein